MKHLAVFFIFFISTILYGQVNKSLKVLTDYNCFYDPELGEYIELKFQFISNKTNNLHDTMRFQSRYKVCIDIFKDSIRVLKDIYTIQSPKFQDSISDDLFDVKRYPIKPGNYLLKLTISDLNLNQTPLTLNQKILIPDFHSTISISDIQVCENIQETSKINMFSRSGYVLFPRLINYYSSECRFLPTYIELYNPKNDSTRCILKTAIYSVEKKSEIAELTSKNEVFVYDVTPIVNNIDISLLPTGSYKLIYSLTRDSINYRSVSYYFDRTNNQLDFLSLENIILDPIFQSSIPKDSLEYFLLSITPISNPMEIPIINKLVKEKDSDKMRKYLQSFWVTTSGRLHAAESWIKYKEQVKIVENSYRTAIFKGYESDRGRVYLKYGAPTAIAVRETSPSEYPYEIWQYDKIKQFSNKRFVFYNPDLVNNHYQLLHSDMQGELKNYRWQQIITKRNSTNQNIDDPNDGNVDHYGGESQDVFNQF